MESEFIENIVGDVMNKLHAMSSSHSTAGLFGIDVHLSKVESLLNMESPDVLIVGIWGMGGIGKTTIAEAVCNKVRSRFEGIFFANFRDKQSDLQRKFLKRLLGQETLNTMVSMSFRDSFHYPLPIMMLNYSYVPTMYRCSIDVATKDLESEFIEKIVGDVLNKLKVMSSSHSTALFGIDVRVNKVESLLKMESPDVLIVGIWGMGGTGKTTIAQAVCNKVRSRFEGILFANFRQELGTGSMADLQRSFLSQLLGQEIRNMGSLSFRDSFVRERLRCKKVFIVLDDVDDVMRLEEWRDLLDGRNSLFGPGSKALITSRDKQVLNNVVDETYKVEGLNYEESLQLFS
ncbi:hypothetical protein POTOM_059532 [Populus tomentosa]|uniref:NB-ARC domain-containing protein n=1 Tax=Populus tomentosa TaxID=118781 RepID=A0A8X7XVL0_POPTO|nr:hypothetical protein POTOM_059532 [Populus tomentosa]